MEGGEGRVRTLQMTNATTRAAETSGHSCLVELEEHVRGAAYQPVLVRGAVVVMVGLGAGGAVVLARFRASSLRLLEPAGLFFCLVHRRELVRNSTTYWTGETERRESAGGGGGSDSSKAERNGEKKRATELSLSAEPWREIALSLFPLSFLFSHVRFPTSSSSPPLSHFSSPRSLHAHKAFLGLSRPSRGKFPEAASPVLHPPSPRPQHRKF